ncbi:MAG: hypothetical protein A07HN63_01804 [uncultured archaeon A07HN63]|nr:MAG: hypothetical protein A07HN63_01804 [uncultured archaeon A07HN63]
MIAALDLLFSVFKHANRGLSGASQQAAIDTREAECVDTGVTEQRRQLGVEFAGHHHGEDLHRLVVSKPAGDAARCFDVRRLNAHAFQRLVDRG